MQFNVMNDCDEQNKLKNNNDDPMHALLVYCIHHDKIVAYKNDATFYSFICPERYREENCEHFFSVDMLCAMFSIQMNGKSFIFSYFIDAFCFTCICVDCDNRVWKGMYDCNVVPLMEKYSPSMKISFG